MDERKKRYLEDYLDLSEDFNATCQLSALRGSHIGPLKDKIFTILLEGEMNYPLEQITNLNEKEWLAEIIREKIFLIMRQEIPYSTHVEVEDVEKKSDIIVIKATIYTSDSHYKKMIIGNGGRMIKAVGIKTRKELELALDKKIYLELEVETDKHWQKRV